MNERDNEQRLGSAAQNDPIAQKLLEAMGEEVSYNVRTPEVPYFDTVGHQRRDAAIGDMEAMAEYETVQFMDDSSPEVLSFVKSLGFDPSVIKSMSIKIEENKPVLCTIEAYAVTAKSNGSTWRPDYRVCPCGCGKLVPKSGD